MAKKEQLVSVQVQIPVVFLREGEQFVAHSPVLDIATAGETFELAKKRFAESVEIFFEELTEKGTLDEVLQDLGWQKLDNQWEPPKVVAHESESFQMPVPA